ncbi:MAG: hypothetical protein IH819_11465, partial [Bacteroidetes bacterium]|nr:hypothetical protein [Bacteroidota bacterium]
YLPLWHFDENILVFSDGSLGCGFELCGKDISCLTIDSINEFSGNVENLINTAKEGLKLQLFYKVNSNVSEIINKHKDISSQAEGIYEPIAKSRRVHLQSNMDQKEYFDPKIYFFIKRKKRITSFSTRPRFQCGIVLIFGFGKKGKHSL